MRILVLNSTIRGKGDWLRAYYFSRYLALEHDVTLITASRDKILGVKKEQTGNLTIIEIASLSNLKNYIPWLYYFVLPVGYLIFDIFYRLIKVFSRKYDLIYGFAHTPATAIPMFMAKYVLQIPIISDWCDWFTKNGIIEKTLSIRIRKRRIIAYKWSKKVPFLKKFIFKLLSFLLYIIHIKSRLIIRIETYLEEKLRKSADRVVVISSVLYQRALDIGISESRLCLIRSGSPLNEIYPVSKMEARLKLGLDIKKKIVEFFGSGQMDMRFLVSAFYELYKETNDVLLLIVGPKSKIVAETARYFGISEAVVQTGYCDDIKIFPYYLGAADVLVIPLIDDNNNRGRWPHKIGDYMAAGRPIVTQDVGDTGQFVREKKIGVVTKADKKSFAEGIKYLLDNPSVAEQMGISGRDVAEKELEWSHLAQKLNNCFLNVRNYKR